MHCHGTHWTPVTSPNHGTRPSDLHSVATPSPNDAWAVGSYVNSERHTLTLTMHWDGTQWTIVPSPNVPSTNGLLTSVATTSANDAWAVGYYQGGGTPWQTLAMRWDGAQWTIVATPNAPNSSSSYLLGVHAQPASEVWAVGYYYTANPFHAHTLALRWDGSQWTVSPSLDIGDDNQFQGVAALASNDLWAVGSSSFIGLDRTHYKTLVERNSDPCATPTATPTTTSTPALLVGHVEWQGRPPQPDSRQQVPITLTLKMGGTEVNYPSQTTDTSGFFTVSVAGLPGGTYAWRAKGFYTPAQTGPAFLANSGALILTGSPVTSAEMGLMRAGDADNDNTVNVADYTILRAFFGHQRCPPLCDYRSDFNGDGIFTIIDFTLLKSNFGQSGAPPITP